MRAFCPTSPPPAHEKNLIQEKLIDKAKLYYAYSRAAEHVEVNITRKNVEKIAKRLGVSLAEFYVEFK